MNFNNLSVTELNNIIKNIFDSEEMLFDINVVGEISSYKITRGVAYFALKDEFSSLNCVMFNAEKEFKIGEKVKITGNLNYYLKLGKLSFNAYKIEKIGEGDIFKKFLEIKQKLTAEGLFDPKNKKPIPENVKRIGVITSSTGAVIRDIINVTKRRNNNVDIVIYDSKVQGNNAQNEITKGINFFSNYNVDVIIVARGGGSKEELDCFNEESVARACFLCNKPIVSAVGHETDFTLIDLASDLRAPTPSSAAELVVKEAKNYKAIILNNMKRIEVMLQFKLKKLENSLNDNIKFLQSKEFNILNKKILSISTLKQKLLNILNFNINKKIEKYNLNRNILLSLNPSSLIERGYTKIFKNNMLVKDSNNLCVDDEIEFTIKSEKLTAKIIKKEKLK